MASLTPTEIAFANAVSLKVPPYNWIPPESPPLKVTVSQRSEYSTSLAKIRDQLPKAQRSNSLGLPQKPSDFRHIDLDKYEKLRERLDHAQQALSQAKNEPHSVQKPLQAARDAAKKAFDKADAPYQLLKDAFNIIVLRIGEACRNLNQAVLAHSSALLTTADLEGQPIAMLDALVNQTTGPDKYLWARMALEDQAQLRQLSRHHDSYDQIKSALAGALNGVLQRAETLDRAIFSSGLPKIDDIRAPSDVLGANRLLLQGSYPGVRKLEKLDLAAYRQERDNYIALLRYLDTHEAGPQGFDPQGTLFPRIPNAVDFGYGRVLMWNFVDPVIEFSPAHRQNLITGITVVSEWKGYHTSSSGVPVRDP